MFRKQWSVLLFTGCIIFNSHAQVDEARIPLLDAQATNIFMHVKQLKQTQSILTQKDHALKFASIVSDFLPIATIGISSSLATYFTNDKNGRKVVQNVAFASATSIIFWGICTIIIGEARKRNMLEWQNSLSNQKKDFTSCAQLNPEERAYFLQKTAQLMTAASIEEEQSVKGIDEKLIEQYHKAGLELRLAMQAKPLK